MRRAADMSSVQGLPEKPVSDDRPDAAPFGAGECPECKPDARTFVRSHPGQLFCTTDHRDAWNARAATRGRKLAPMAIVARLTRNGTRGDRATGARAAAEQHALITRWRDEDAAAGRMSHTEYLARRYRAGFDPL